jgi:hypothetical protein
MSTDRRAAYRELIRRLDPAENAKRALEQGLYVEPSGSISERLANSLELQPTSTHMLVGGIGSGKTTQLLRVQQRLENVGDVRACFVDVLARQKIEHLNRKGVLLALAGLELSNAVASVPGSKDIEDAQREIKDRAKGFWLEWWEAQDGDEGGMVWEPGIIVAPEKEYALQQLEQAVQTLSGVLPFRPVMLFDGLDRVTDVSAFAVLVSHDMPMLKQAGIGAVVVAPQHARTWQHGAMQDYFDALHLHGATHTGDGEGIAFLRAVLHARAADIGVLPEALCTTIANLSGGIVRDLLALARASAEEAYRLGADAVEEVHVRAAADQLGRNLLMGIEQDMVTRLKSLAPMPAPNAWRQPVPFTVATETDVMLLLRRLIIEVPTTPVHYILHPTIVPLIAGLRRRA